jgi:hypothetical protein
MLLNARRRIPTHVLVVDRHDSTRSAVEPLLKVSIRKSVMPSTFVLVDAVLPISNHAISEYLLLKGVCHDCSFSVVLATITKSA